MKRAADGTPPAPSSKPVTVPSGLPSLDYSRILLEELQLEPTENLEENLKKIALQLKGVTSLWPQGYPGSPLLDISQYSEHDLVRVAAQPRRLKLSLFECI
jgi:hypothetical protein